MGKVAGWIKRGARLQAEPWSERWKVRRRVDPSVWGGQCWEKALWGGGVGGRG